MVDNFFWNQAVLHPGHSLHDGLVSLIAFDNLHSPVPVGSGFIIGAFGAEAVACSAAHIFEEIHSLQNPNPRHHSTTLREFMPAAEPLDVDPTAVRALVCFNTSGEAGAEMALLDWVIVDRTSDLAVFSLKAQDSQSTSVFAKEFELTADVPEVGEQIAILGYCRMSVDEVQEGDLWEFQVGRELVLRTGRVTHVHPEGHWPCRGPCLATSVPVLPGMSGSPVMRYQSNVAPGTPMKPFGFVCSDLQTNDDPDKMNRSLSGESIVPLIMPRLEISGGQRHTIITLAKAVKLTGPH